LACHAAVSAETPRAGRGQLAGRELEERRRDLLPADPVGKRGWRGPRLPENGSGGRGGKKRFKMLYGNEL